MSDWRKKPRRGERLPDDILERIDRLGERPNRYLDWLRSEGEGFVRRLLAHKEEAAALAEKWYPRLRELEQECRSRAPLPAVEHLDAIQKAQYEVYRQKIAEAERIAGGSCTVYEFSLPLVGLAAAQGLWPTELERAVLMTPDEWSRWRRIYEHPIEAPWWSVSYWWSVGAPSPEDDHLAFFKFPTGKTAWTVGHGTMWGSLAGGETTELWSWDGTRAEFLGVISVTSF